MAEHAPMTETFDCVLSPELAKNEFPKFEDANKSYARKYLTREIWDKLKDKTTGYGWTLARAVNTAALNTDSLVGCHAGDIESYELFSEFFNPVIEEYHKGYSPDKQHVTDMDPSKLKGGVSDPSTIRSSRIRVGRNLFGFPLNPSGTKEDRLKVEALMKKVFATLSGDLAGTYYSLATMTDDQRKQLVADHFLFRPGDRFQAASGYHNFWPAGRGIFHNKDKTFLLWINEGDHIRIISMQPGGDVSEVFNRLARGVTAIEEGIKKVTGNAEAFLHTAHLGMITCCPSNLGTGLRGSVHITLPKLFKSHSLGQLQAITSKMGCQTRGTDGEHTEITHTADISNLYRIGHKEYELVQMMVDAVNTMIKMEKEL